LLNFQAIFARHHQGLFPTPGPPLRRGLSSLVDFVIAFVERSRGERMGYGFASNERA
jgi:hypothetical protein